MAKYKNKSEGTPSLEEKTSYLGIVGASMLRPYNLLIYLYQSTRFMRPACCRFYPSCSDYCVQAIDTYGLIAGAALTLKRLLKCHPWHPGGIDLVSSSHIVITLQAQPMKVELNEF